MKTKITLALVLAAAVAGGLVGAVVGLAFDGNSSATTAASAAPAAPVFAPSPPAPASSRALRRALTPESIYRRHAPGVVVITATKGQLEALGSGFVIDKKGDVVTNDHVVQGGTGIRVGFSSGASYPAKVVGSDPSTDVAVVRVRAPAQALHPLAFDESASIEVGDPVYAIGNPFGLDRTMTAGIVSATGRDIEAPNGLTIPKAIQTDAPINHGNSGGPLLDRFGRVVGINAQIEGGTVDANVGIGFAIPSDTAKSVAEQLLATGHAQHAWLGVQAETIDPSLAGVVHGLPAHGIAIARVIKGSPAAKAGLEAASRQAAVNGVGVLLGGDVIVRVDGKSVSTSQQLAGFIAAHKPGDRLKLELVRDGKHRTVTITLGNVPTQTS